MTAKADPNAWRDAAMMTAVREHSVNSRRTRCHVIVCHDLDRRSHSLYEMFNFAGRVSDDVLAELVNQLATDIINDANMLIKELEGIKGFAQRQINKLQTPSEE